VNTSHTDGESGSRSPGPLLARRGCAAPPDVVAHDCGPPAQQRRLSIREIRAIRG
jgi:hypothetical protein